MRPRPTLRRSLAAFTALLLLACGGGPDSGGGAFNLPDHGTGTPDTTAKPDTPEAPTPEVRILEPAAGAFLRGDAKVTATVDLKGQAFGDATVALGGIQATTGTLPADGRLSGTFPSAALPDGPSTVAVTVRTPAGAVGSDQIPVFLDNSPPLLQWFDPPEALVATEDVTVRAGVADTASRLASVQVRLVGDDLPCPSEPKKVLGQQALGLTAKCPIGALSPGAHVIEIRVSDQAGNTTTATRTFAVPQPPPFLLPDIYSPPGTKPQIRDGGVVDADGDGNPDLLLATNGGLFLYPGLTGGRFGNAVQLREEQVDFIALDDRDGDGVLDLVALTNGGEISTLQVFPGSKSEGTFKLSEPTLPSAELSGSATALILANFDADDRADAVALTEADTQSLALFTGTDGGGFGAPTPFGGVGRGQEALVADVNKDGVLDVVVVRADVQTVSLFRGDGKGGFLIAIDSDLAGSARATALEDIDGNGLPDLIVAYGPGSAKEKAMRESAGFHAGQLDVFTGRLDTANTQFGFPTAIPTWGTIEHLALGDVDGDGKPDLIGLSPADHHVIVWPQVDGSFDYERAFLFNSGGTPQRLFVADLNRDGRAEIIVLNQDAVWVLRSEATRPRRAIEAFPLSIQTIPVDAGPATVNFDALVDFTVMGRNQPGFETAPPKFVLETLTSRPSAPPAASDLLNTRSKFDALWKTSVNGQEEQTPLPQPKSLLIADFDLDDVDDVLIVFEGQSSELPAAAAYLRRGQDFSLFAGIGPIPDTTVRSAALGRFLGATGPPQVLLAMERRIPNGDPLQLLRIYDTGGSGFASKQDLSLDGRGTIIRVADMNEDGFKDLLVLQPDQDNVAYFQAQQALLFDSLLVPYALGKKPTTFHVGELTGDDHLDMVVANASGLLVAPGDGKGDFRPPAPVPGSSTSLTSLELADLNQDGQDDLIGLDAAAGELVVQMSRPDGTYGEAFHLPAPPNAGKMPGGGIFVGDSSGSGCREVIVLSPTTGTLHRYLNRSCD